MSEKALKFGDVETNKKKNHAFNQPITLNLVDKDTIVITDNLKHSNKGSKYFIRYNDDKLLDLYVLFYLKKADIYNILTMMENMCLLKLKMIMYW